MDSRCETASVIALLRNGSRATSWYAEAIGRAGSARAVLDEEHGLLAEAILSDGVTELNAWEERRIHVVSAFDAGYPSNLRQDSRSPLLLFVAGELQDRDRRAVAVVGTRQPSPHGRQLARAISHRLADEGFTVVSGLATGIDATVHDAALEREGRTLAVVGTGLDHCYPRQNSGLQRRILMGGAVISQFWPETRPSRRTFPLRNALMAGLTEASVIVEATARSGTLIEARAALEQRRVVVLLDSLLEQQWARDLAEHPGVKVARSPAHAVETLQYSIAQPALL